ncbi:hypothetical protein K456DRAFT_819770 [Colletotrichum gloeosporioides 23]|nr:hypothetical protein K456DRAFT_819770 [Colletotrichum gloeosporioides 23]
MCVCMCVCVWVWVGVSGVGEMGTLEGMEWPTAGEKTGWVSLSRSVPGYAQHHSKSKQQGIPNRRRGKLNQRHPQGPPETGRRHDALLARPDQARAKEMSWEKAPRNVPNMMRLGRAVHIIYHLHYTTLSVGIHHSSRTSPHRAAG